MKLAILQIGLATPAGDAFDEFLAVLHAGLNEPVECPWVDKRKRPFGLYLALPPKEATGAPRQLALLHRALGPTPRELPLVLACPSLRHPEGDDALLRDIEGIRTDASRVVREGMTSFHRALCIAWELLESGEDEVVVAAVDSFYDASRLERLDRACRIHAIGTESGFIPGEGAAAFRVAKADAKATRFPCIDFLATDEDPYGDLDEGPLPALVLTQLLRAAAPMGDDGRQERLSEHAVNTNGEFARQLEWDRVAIRASELLVGSGQTIADTLGDAGAAHPAFECANLMLRWSHGLSERTSPGVVATLSDGRKRGVIRIVPSSQEDAAPSRFTASTGIPRLTSTTEPIVSRSPHGLRHARLRSALDELAGGYWLRKLAPGQPWTDGGPVEARLLKALDVGATMALGAKTWIDDVLAYARDGLPGDSARRFAAGLILCKTGGDEGPEALAMACAQDPDQGYCDALCLSEHPSAGPRLVEHVLGSSDPRARTFGWAATRFMRIATRADVWERAEEDDELEGLRILARTQCDPMGMAQALTDEPPESPHSRLAFALALLMVGDPARGRELLLELAEHPCVPIRTEALASLCLVATDADTTLLREGLNGDLLSAEQLGWSGLPSLVPTLLARLRVSSRERSRDDEPSEAERVAEAIMRITGLVPHVGDLSDPDTQKLLAPELEARWRANRHRFGADRYVFGMPMRAMLLAGELSGPSRPAARARTARQLLLRRVLHPVETTDWVERQAVGLTRLRQRLAELGPHV